MTQYFDAHNHLQDYRSPEELAAAMAEAGRAGVARMICCATRPGDWGAVRALAASLPGVTPAYGVHPWFAAEAAGNWLGELELLLGGGQACAGEIGLDGARAVPGQEEVFAAQLALARRSGRPAVIHCVRMWGKLLELLRAGAPRAFMLHAYGGAPELVEELAGLGAYFSFGGGLAEPRREKLRAALLAVLRGRLLLESEAPGPQASRRGPAAVTSAAAAAAGILGVSAVELAAASSANAAAFLGS